MMYYKDKDFDRLNKNVMKYCKGLNGIERVLKTEEFFKDNYKVKIKNGSNYHYINAAFGKPERVICRKYMDICISEVASKF